METQTNGQKVGGVGALVKSMGIGFLVWWALREVDIPRADLRTAFAMHGLERAVPRDPRPSAMLSRACREALVGKGGDWAFDRVRDDASYVTAALSKRVTDASVEKVEYTQVGALRIEKATGATLPEGGGAVGDTAFTIIQEAQAHFRHVRDNATTEDLRASLTHAMRGRRRDLLLGAVEVNGVFFVRSEQRAKVDALQAWVRERGFGQVSVLAIADDGASRAQVIEGTTRTIDSRVREVLAECEQIAARLRDAEDEDVDRILSPYLDRFALAESAADLYADVLGNMASDLRAKIAEARAEFTKRIV